MYLYFPAFSLCKGWSWPTTNPKAAITRATKKTVEIFKVCRLRWKNSAPFRYLIWMSLLNVQFQKISLASLWQRDSDTHTIIHCPTKDKYSLPLETKIDWRHSYPLILTHTSTVGKNTNTQAHLYAFAGSKNDKLNLTKSHLHRATNKHGVLTSSHTHGKDKVSV